MARVLQAALLVVLVGGVLLYFRDTVRTVAMQAYHDIAPCTVPITYSIERIDTRFEISTSSLSAALADAARVWSERAGAELFREVSEHGDIKVRLMYDRRQATTEVLQDLDDAARATMESYNATLAQYDAESAAYRAARDEFETRHAAFEDNVSLYEREVRGWNARGGAPEDVYRELEERREGLEDEEATLRALQDDANVAARRVNALVDELNVLAEELNLSVDEYNKVGESMDSEFEEAIYESRPGLQTVTVFEFGSAGELARVLAHEFGHALGLGHVGERGSIMYRLNEGETLELTSADQEALAALCSGA